MRTHPMQVELAVLAAVGVEMVVAKGAEMVVAMVVVVKGEVGRHTI